MRNSIWIGATTRIYSDDVCTFMQPNSLLMCCSCAWIPRSRSLEAIKGTVWLVHTSWLRRWRCRVIHGHHRRRNMLKKVIQSESLRWMCLSVCALCSLVEFQMVLIMCGGSLRSPISAVSLDKILRRFSHHMVGWRSWAVASDLY